MGRTLESERVQGENSGRGRPNFVPDKLHPPASFDLVEPKGASIVYSLFCNQMPIITIVSVGWLVLLRMMIIIIIIITICRLNPTP